MLRKAAYSTDPDLCTYATANATSIDGSTACIWLTAAAPEYTVLPLQSCVLSDHSSEVHVIGVHASTQQPLRIPRRLC